MNEYENDKTAAFLLTFRFTARNLQKFNPNLKNQVNKESLKLL